MNQKLEKAQRKMKRGTQSELDIARVARNYARKEALIAVGPKFPKPRKHKELKLIPPTWPKSDDQKAQSRPLIIIRPFKQMKSWMEKAWFAEVKAKFANAPKGKLDLAAVNATVLR